MDCDTAMSMETRVIERKRDRERERQKKWRMREGTCRDVVVS